MPHYEKPNYYELKIEPRLGSIKHWIREGMTTENICKKLGIGTTTFYKYSSKNSKFFRPELDDALNAGKDELQIKFEKSLYKECFGYEIVETKAELEESNPRVEGAKPIVIKRKQTKVTKWIRPNASLLMFTLCNKYPEKWKRVDKEVLEAIEDGRLELNITDTHIKNAFKALYPGVKDKKDDNKNEV